MSSKPKQYFCELLVIGTGMTGMAATLFAAIEKIDVIQVGITGELGFASGLLDLLGVHPIESGTVITDPWQGLKALSQAEPNHPYAHLKPDQIKKAWQLFLTFLEESGYPHVTLSDQNMTILTPAGTFKTTYAVPHSMAFGYQAMTQKLPCLLIDFEGLKGFSAWQIATSLSKQWPGLRPHRISFPDRKGELYAESLARSFDALKVCEQVVDAVKPHIKDAQAVAFPAILGVHRTKAVRARLTKGFGLPVFEVPTMPPTIAGLRLREIFENRLPQMGVQSLFHQRITNAGLVDDGCWCFDVEENPIVKQIVARSVILASGRFLGKGLFADRHGIRETIFNLALAQPQKRTYWHQKDLFHFSGHPINRAGVEVDDLFRPLDATSKVLYPNLFAAGSILAHQDWTRQKCGSGLAVSTAFGAVKASKSFLKHSLKIGN
jgi:glycerol-3-phosphate dehydrogenase subunit B